MTLSTIVIILLVIHILQNDARLWQVVKELKELRKEMAKKREDIHVA